MAGVGEAEQVGVGGVDDELGDEVLFAGLHAEAAGFAATLLAVDGDGRALEVAGVGDGDGKTVPDLCNGHPCAAKRSSDNENLFPKFTTWRQQIDGQYWFPVYTKADDELHFKTEDVHIREIVKYEDYKRFGTNTKILYEGKEIPNAPKDQKKPDGTQPPTTQPPAQSPPQK